MIYEGTIQYAADKDPFESKFGGYTWGVKVTPKDPNAPKQNEHGSIGIYKDTESDEGQYIKTLKVGDPITLVWQANARTPYYQVVIPAGGQPVAQAPARSKAQVTVNNTVQTVQVPDITTLSDTDREGWQVILDNTGDMLEAAIKYADQRWAKYTEEQRLNIALRLFITGKTWWRQGATVSGSETGEDTESESFIKNIQIMIDNGEQEALAFIKSASMKFDTEVDTVLAAIKDLGIQSPEWMVDDNKKWELAQLLGEYMAMTGSGADKDVAITAMVDKYGIRRPPQEPLF